MSTSETEPSSATEEGSWWSSWLSSAKEKSMSALNATKRDLSEFVSVISTDTKAAVTGATTNIKGLIQESGEEEGKPKEAGSQQRTSHPTPLPAIVPDTPPLPYDRWQAQLFALQTNTDTYLSNPKDEKAFSEWQSGFNVQAQQSEVSSLLVSCSHVRTLHAQLVPAKVSYEAFWQRYFYKVQLLQQEEERRMELMARAKPREEMKWDEDIEEVGSVDALKRGSEHPRSESSDSFVCVSEEPVVEPESEVGGGTTEEVDSEDWEWLEGVGERGGGGEEEERGGGEEGDKGGGEEGDKGGGGEGSKEEEKDSDWENWED